MTRKFFAPPTELPGGLWEALQPLYCWIKAQLAEAYRMGYSAGRGDAAIDYKEIAEAAERNKRKRRIAQ